MVAPFIAAFATLVAPAMAADLTVTVTGIRNAEGLVQVCLFSRSNAFPDCSVDPTVLRQQIQAAAGQVRARFEGLVPGIYAVSVFHDEKRTGKVETNFLGIPRSGLGASNDPKPRFGAPSFEAAAFTVPDRPAAVTLRMQYP